MHTFQSSPDRPRDLSRPLLILAAVAIGAYVRLGEWMWVVVANENGLAKTLLVAGVTQMCLYYADLYNFRRMSDRRELFVRLAQALAAASFALAVLYYWFPALVIGRGVFAIAAGLAITFIVGWRLAFEWMSRQVGPRERLLLVGTSAAAVALAQELFQRRQELGVEIVGFIDPDPARVGIAHHQSRRRRHHRRHPVNRPRPSCGPRRGEPGRCPRQAADGQAPRDEDRRRVVRSPGVGVRRVHGQDRRREPAPELVHLFARVPEQPLSRGIEACARRALRGRRPCSSRARSWRSSPRQCA